MYTSESDKNLAIDITNNKLICEIDALFARASNRFPRFETIGGGDSVNIPLDETNQIVFSKHDNLWLLTFSYKAKSKINGLGEHWYGRHHFGFIIENGTLQHCYVISNADSLTQEEVVIFRPGYPEDVVEFLPMLEEILGEVDKRI